MANVGKTPDQDQVFYHLKMALTLVVIKARAFCRKVSIALLPAGIRASLEQSRQNRLPISERSVVSAPISGAFVLPDLEHIKTEFKDCVRNFMDHLVDSGAASRNRDKQFGDAVDLEVMVYNYIDQCKSLDAIVKLVDERAPGTTRKGLFTALDEIISETGVDSTLSEGARKIISEATERDEPFTGLITGDDSDMPWVVRADREQALKALKSSFLDYLLHMIRDAEGRSLTMGEEGSDLNEEEVQVQPELPPVGVKMKPGQRRSSEDSGVYSTAGSLSRTSSMPDLEGLADDLEEARFRSARSSVNSDAWEDEVGDLEDDVFEPPTDKKFGTESDWDESFVDDWKLHEIRAGVDACESYDDLYELVKEKAPKQYRYALLSGLRDDFEKYGPYLE